MADLTRARIPGVHRPIMVAEVLRYLRPRPGEVAVDCTLGGGGHARAILERVHPGGRLIGLDVDPLELPRTEARLRADGFGPERSSPAIGNFAALPEALAGEGIAGRCHPRGPRRLVDAARHAARVQPQGRRSARHADESAGRRTGVAHLVATERGNWRRLLDRHADEPHAVLIARLLKQQPAETTHAFERLVRSGLTSALPHLPKADVKMSVRRTFQALRIAVNDEFAALDALLRRCRNASRRAAASRF